MANRDELLALAERCERATGPDRGIDGLIFARLNPNKRIIIGTEPGRFPQKAIYGTPLDLIEMLEENGGDGADYLSAPPYTASLDAAMTLKPDDWRFAGSESMAGGFYTHLITRELVADGARAHAEAHADSLALAICAAALRSRAASGTLTEGGDAKQAPSASLSGPTAERGDAHDQSR